MRCKIRFFRAIAIGVTFWAIGQPTLAQPALPVTTLPPTTWKISQQEPAALPQTAALIYVTPIPNPTGGDGSPNNPYPSITAAIATKPLAGTVIQLNQGLYSQETGESFPIKLPSGVTLRGEPSVRGINTVIKGSGRFISPSFASQNITVLAEDNVRVEGITLTNPSTRGTALWVESSKGVVINNNSFVSSDREGLFLTGTANAIVNENVFKNNGANGLSAVGSSTGEIRNNIFESTGFGLAIGQKSQVNVSNNNIINNTDGIIISNLSAPTLRNNLITDNKRNGVVILQDRKGYPTPDLGTSLNLGKNIFRNNGGKDLNNNSGVPQVAVGNELDPKKIAGEISFSGDTPTAPAPQLANTPVPPLNNPPKTPVPNVASSTVDAVEITRSPETSFKPPATPPPALAPSNNTVFIEPLPDVPQSNNSPNNSPKPSWDNAPILPSTPKPSNPSPNRPQSSNDILIDRDPVPTLPPQIPSPPATQFIPNTPPPQTIPDNPIPTPLSPLPPIPIPYNNRVAALIPPPAREQAPYLVVIPTNEDATFNRVKSVVPSAKIIPSRFGNIIMVQGYPDRDRAEVVKTIMRSELGLDARVIHQNTL
ncbi:DUF1565 domain-containing protein [Pseudanabaena sp. FACHB-1998]|uniref:DUF1565 domain-containing protein n=1 Tax=Pseudanabaena sp. FACHB-1998 TaxID=2692858 RepID=UPI001680A2E6|nr:DUF1565 domain-containing protein [Pseudanabaena sp. FACHB-1998]MBD2178875.1 DUF1565 domain-containing protein [Pseudanabaena sp. FACHB-1998]